VYNGFVQWSLPRHPRLFSHGYITTLGDALLNVAMVILGGGFSTPLYFLLYTVTIASAMRYGYGPAALVTATFLGFDGAEHYRSGVGLDGPLLIRSGFLVLTGRLASYLRQQAHHADAALQVQLHHARHENLHDRLTGIANRTFFASILQQALAARAEPFAVLCLDLEKLKEVNDTFGQRVGDLLVQETARRLGQKTSATATLARWSDSEFAVLLPAADARQAELTARTLLQAVEQPLEIDGLTLEVVARVGIAVAAEHGSDVEDLQRQAEFATHIARSQSAPYAFYCPEADFRQRDRMELAADLKRAVERDELSLVYQPIVSLASGRIVEVEALVRWQHPRRGRVSPAEFIPIAEETGTILEIGRWVLLRACTDALRLRAAGGSHADLVMSVNVSGRQFQQADVAADVDSVLVQTGLDAAGLKVELTESASMANPEVTIAAMWNLRGMGVRLAIDDFGTGYSSLGYLKRFPIDTLKIDKGFVDGLGVHPEDEAIVAATMAFAHAVGLSTTVEGVETLEQLHIIGELGADRIQGYLVSKPVSVDELSELLAADRTPRLPRVTRMKTSELAA
jgi:diguanylate cyclase (GGDEF)-like protein